MSSSRLIAEWQPSEAVILAWPDEATDWAPWLEQVRATYLSLMAELHANDAVIVLLCRTSSMDSAKSLIPSHLNVLLIDADYNDTWVRDYAFLTVQTQHGPAPIEFTFNGWGNKFDAQKDNQINQTALAPLCNLPLVTFAEVAEGGALEIDDAGCLLSTQFCLRNPQRNGDMTLAQYQRCFERALGITDFVVLEHGHLQGDDTDGHIDTLVRLTPEGNLVAQGCDNRPTDAHFNSLCAMIDECRNKMPQRLVYSLPLCELINAEGERLPASYANYLVCNGAVLVPTYGVEEDQLALAILQQAYPKHLITPVDCAPLINQFGSLHCITMQVPTGTFKHNILSLAKRGVFHYAP